MKTFEYLRIEFESDGSGEEEDKIIAKLDALGKHGWEAIHVLEYRSIMSRKYVYFLKKEEATFEPCIQPPRENVHAKKKNKI